jgi:hypothetical protein
MATNATNYAKYVAGSPAAFMGAEWEGKVRCIHDTYTFASAIAGTVINVGILKAGEVFLFGYINAADLGSATTLTLGDTELDGSASILDADRYLAATVFTTAGQNTLCLRDVGVGYKATKDMIIQVTVGVETANGAIEVMILKACPN